MSNRSYLYVRDKQSGRMDGVSEWPGDIPLSHLLLASVHPQLVSSNIWESEQLLAIRADFEAGRSRLFDFLKRVQHEGLLPDTELEEAVREAADFLGRWEGRELEVILEPTEVLEMHSDDVEWGCRQLCEKVLLHLDTYLDCQLEHMRRLKAAGREDDIRETLGLSWDTHLYYDFGEASEEDTDEAEQADERPFVRRQTEMQSNTVFARLQQMQRLFLDHLPKDLDWDMLRIYVWQIANPPVSLVYYQGLRQYVLEPGAGLIREFKRLADDILDIMYRYAPEEGAWLQMTLSITHDYKFDVRYNYEDLDALTGVDVLSSAALIPLFTKYPRSRLFTPAWMQEMMPGIPYLVSDREKAAALCVDLSTAEGLLRINGTPLELPFESGGLVRLFGEEKLKGGHRVWTRYDGRKDTYANKTYQVWEAYGMMALRSEGSYQQASALYLQLLPRVADDPSVPVPESIFSGTFTVDGYPFTYTENAVSRHGRLELVTFDRERGYVEIACPPSARKSARSWHDDQWRSEELCRAAWDDREQLQALARAEKQGRQLNGQESNAEAGCRLNSQFFTHVREGIGYGEAAGRSRSTLGNLFLSLLAEALQGRLAYRNVAPVSESDLDFAFSAFTLLGYDRGDLQKLIDRLPDDGLNLRGRVVDRFVTHRLSDEEMERALRL